MSTPAHPDDRPLSPISRRAFLLAGPPTAAAGALALTRCGGSSYGDYGDYADCYYCDGPGQDYQACDGAFYCDYFDYADVIP